MLVTFQDSKQILNWGFKLEKGTIFGNLYFQNYFEFCIKTSKTQNTKVVHLDKIYIFAFELNLKFCLVFKLHKRAKNQDFKIRVSPPIFSESSNTRDFTTTLASLHNINTL